MDLQENQFQINEKISRLVLNAEQAVLPVFQRLENIAFYNQAKVLRAFQKNRVSEAYFMPTTGYGYDDAGREALDAIYADIFGAEDALVRHNIISGTHALSLCFYGVLRPGDTLLSVTGKPYDTLEEVIGIRESGMGSLKDFGIQYAEVPLKDGSYNIPAIIDAVDKNTKAVLIQRSKGYGFRNSLSCDDMKRIIQAVKGKKSDVICIVDNCYGEFVEEREPTQVGADLIAGSLIKNPGGGLALTGGYVAGRKDLVELASYRLNSPGIGKECGARLNMNRNMFQGLFLAPHVVLQSLKSAVLCARIFESLGYKVSPSSAENRSCIIEAIQFEREDLLIAFCEGIQKGAPVDSFVVPAPWDMPGYGDQVIMAAGAFVSGASIELSADAPIKPPYIAYMQGGLTYESAKIGFMLALQHMMEKGLLF